MDEKEGTELLVLWKAHIDSLVQDIYMFEVLIIPYFELHKLTILFPENSAFALYLTFNYTWLCIAETSILLSLLETICHLSSWRNWPTRNV